MSQADKIEAAAKALFMNRFGRSEDLWKKYKAEKPDFIEVYRENARIVLKAAEGAA